MKAPASPEKFAHCPQFVFDPILAAVRAYASEGEIAETMRQVFGGYREAAVF